MPDSPARRQGPAAAAGSAGEPTLSLPPPPTATSNASGAKRAAPSLLPPFEPLSSSPGLPRPPKRRRSGSAGASRHDYLKYPTPVPTSSTGILSSSPPRVRVLGAAGGLGPSGLSERAPLSAVPSVELDENGEMLLMGRSSNSSHYQLSGNRLVSRIHVQARYIPAPTPLEPNKVEIICSGWNGLKLHCQGKTWELAKGDTFTSETENAEMMLDVHDFRVLVHWPKKDAAAHLSDSSWEDSPRLRPGRHGDTVSPQSSPLRRPTTRIKSPESPSLAKQPPFSGMGRAAMLSSNVNTSDTVQIYEDASEDEQDLTQSAAERNASFAPTDLDASFSSDLSEPDENEENEPDENDPQEENDMPALSFGPFSGHYDRATAFASLSPRHSAARVASGTPPAAPSSEEEAEDAEPPLNDKIDVAAVANHVVNQLAFSRLSSTPLPTIMHNLPAEEARDLGKDDLRRVIEATACIGTIPRQGKDAAGKPLESEYYYVPEQDADEARRLAVTDGLRKPTLRACRKQHKQYYWKRPKTP